MEIPFLDLFESWILIIQSFEQLEPNPKSRGRYLRVKLGCGTQTDFSTDTAHPERYIHSRLTAMLQSSSDTAQRRVFHCGAFGEQSSTSSQFQAL